MKSKIITAILMITAAMYLKADPLFQYSKTVNMNVNAGFIAFILSDSFILIVTFIAVVLVFSVLPFKTPKPYFLIVRTGKRKWLLKHMAYIAAVSLAIVLVMVAAYVLFLRGRIYFCSGWGKMATRICNGSDPAAMDVNLMIHMDVLAALSPAMASLWTLANAWILIFTFGNICFTLNMFLNEYAGTVVCAVLVFIHMLRGFVPDFLLAYFSPVSWISVNIIDFTGNSAMPDQIYPLCIYSGIICGLWIFNLAASRKGSRMIEKIL